MRKSFDENLRGRKIEGLYIFSIWRRHSWIQWWKWNWVSSPLATRKLTVMRIWLQKKFVWQKNLSWVLSLLLGVLHYFGNLIVNLWIDSCGAKDELFSLHTCLWGPSLMGLSILTLPTILTNFLLKNLFSPYTKILSKLLLLIVLIFRGLSDLDFTSLNLFDLLHTTTNISFIF